MYEAPTTAICVFHKLNKKVRATVFFILIPVKFLFCGAVNTPDRAGLYQIRPNKANLLAISSKLPQYCRDNKQLVNCTHLNVKVQAKQIL